MFEGSIVRNAQVSIDLVTPHGTLDICLNFSRAQFRWWVASLNLGDQEWSGTQEGKPRHMNATHGLEGTTIEDRKRTLSSNMDPLCSRT
jgi:hypothetical protein